MYYLPFFDAPNRLAAALITGRERTFVLHFMLQQTYDPTGPDAESLDLYARSLAAPGSLHAGIEYFHQHHLDADRNRRHAKTKLEMPVLPVGGSASFGAHLEPEIRPLAEHLTSVMLDCGHYLAEEQPDELVDILLTFFDNVH